MVQDGTETPARTLDFFLQLKFCLSPRLEMLGNSSGLSLLYLLDRLFA